jgi:predicted transcriptional regulator
MRYRSRTDIISDILDAANGGGATRTKIMYKAYLSYNQLKEYLMFLTENNLLSHDPYSQTFKTTEKGIKFLDICNQMDDMIKPVLERQRQVQI